MSLTLQRNKVMVLNLKTFSHKAYHISIQIRGIGTFYDPGTHFGLGIRTF